MSRVSVNVGVRIRPLNEAEIRGAMPLCFNASPDALNVEELDVEGNVQKNWSYDHVFGPDCSNQYIFQSMGVSLVDAALEGYNTVLFMYGQTSSGKTFTLFGGGDTTGVIAHAMEHVQLRVNSSTDTEYVIKFTYAELYNEELKDLLAVTPVEGLKIIDDPNLGPTIQNITEASFTTPAEVKKLLDEGEKKRCFGVTNMNAHSSRSHVLVRLNIESRKVPFKPVQPLRASWGKDKPMCVSTLNLVDLAGSERSNKSGTSGQSLKEGSFINKSLLTLGTVISNLSDGKSGQHIPYRNSKLTRLLASALGGNAKTSMITCISPASGNLLESLSTLRFASRAKRIVNEVQKNEFQDLKSLAARLHFQNAELDQLRSQLELSRQLGFVDGDSGETLRDKAIGASKNWHTLKFLMLQAPKAIKALKKKNLPAVAEKMHDDLKAALAGTRDLSDIMEEHTDVISTHLTHEEKIISKLVEFNMMMSSDAIISKVEEKAVFEMGSDDGSVGEVFQIGGSVEETLISLETSLMQGEDFRSSALSRMRILENELADAVASGKSERKTAEALKIECLDLQDKLKNRELVVASLQKTLDDIKSASVSDMETMRAVHDEHKERIAELVQIVADKEVTVRDEQQKLSAKETEMASLRHQSELLRKELEQAHASRKMQEEETVRVRNELRTQMDRLRSNMHSMLEKGGDHAKSLEAQNQLLSNEMEALRDEMEAVQQGSSRLAAEMGHLRSEIQWHHDDKKLNAEALLSAASKEIRLKERIQALRIEVTGCMASCAVADRTNEKLRQQMEHLRNESRAEIEKKDEELKAIRKESNAALKSLETDMELLRSELKSARKETELAKSNDLRKAKSSAAELARAEKKLGQHLAVIEESKSRSNEALVRKDAIIRTLRAEIVSLKKQLGSLKLVVDSVNGFLEAQQLLELERSSEEYLEGSGDSDAVDADIGSTTDGDNITSSSLSSNSEQQLQQGTESTLKQLASLQEIPYFQVPLKVAVAKMQPLVEESAQFKLLKASFMLLQRNLEFSLADETLFRRFIIADCSKDATRLAQNISTIQAMREHQFTVAESKSILQNTVEKLRSQCDSLQNKSDELERELASYKANYADLLTAYQAVSDHKTHVERQLSTAQMQLGKHRADLEGVTQDLNFARAAKTEAEALMTEAVENYYMLKSEFDLLSQDLEIIQAERDELANQFLGRPVEFGGIGSEE